MCDSNAMDSRLNRIFAGSGGGGGPHPDSPLVDSSEQVYISSLALLKMLKHGALLASFFSKIICHLCACILAIDLCDRN